LGINTQPPDRLTMLTTRAEHVRNHMRKKSFYLGDPLVHRRLTWMATEYGDVVVKNYSSSPSDASSVSSSGRVVQPAILSGIVRLTHEDFRLSSDGYWRGPTNIAPTMADVALSCTGAPPQHRRLAAEFENVVGNVNMLINQTRDVRHRISSCCIPSATSLQLKLKFCHVLFEERSEALVDSDDESGPDSGNESGQDSSDESGQESSDGSDDEEPAKLDYGPVSSLNIRNWPTNSEEAAAAIYAMRRTHRVLRLEAFDTRNRAIYPSDYRRYLKGAVVQIFFTLTRFVSFRSNRNAPIDVFIAEIIVIRRLESLHWDLADNVVDPPMYVTPSEVFDEEEVQGKNKKIKLEVD